MEKSFSRMGGHNIGHNAQMEGSNPEKVELVNIADREVLVRPERFELPT
jgi:hypothetical protein